MRVDTARAHRVLRESLEPSSSATVGPFTALVLLLPRLSGGGKVRE